MKLATLARTARATGRLVVVSRDLAYATDARGIANDPSGGARRLDAARPAGSRRSRSHSKPARCRASGSASMRRCSPLPRAYQWIDGSAYLSHVELVRKARGAAMPPDLWTDPLLYQGGSDAFLSPREPIRMPDEGLGIDFEARSRRHRQRCPDGRGQGRGRRCRSSSSSSSTMSPCATSFRRNSPRASASSSRNPLRPFRRSRSLRTNSAPHGTAGACIFPCWSASTASRSGGRMPAPE